MSEICRESLFLCGNLKGGEHREKVCVCVVNGGTVSSERETTVAPSIT